MSLPLIAASLALLASTAAGQTADPPPAGAVDPPPAQEPEPASPISLAFSLRYESDYFFRGIAQRTDSFNLQPAASVSFKLLEQEDFSLSILGGVWNNFSDDTAPGAVGSFREHWYEADLYAGAAIALDRFTLSAVYTWYLSPSSDFTAYDDITTTLSYNDAGLWDDDERFAINPWVSLAVETRNAAAGPDSGVWLGLGLKPTINFGETPLGAFALSFPLGVGLGLDDYYQRADGSSDTFGHFEAGVSASFTLSDHLGPAAPTLDLGLRHLWLDGMTEEANSDDDSEFVFTVGLTWAF